MRTANPWSRTCLAALGLAAGGSGAATPSAAADAGASCCAVVELRQYSLHPHRFDPFVKLFEDEFLEPLEAAGMTVIGQFRDLDDPNRFVWLRGFRDMPARAVALAAFYDGSIWKARRDAANENFTDTDNVLLLHPAPGTAGIRLPATGAGSGRAGSGVIVATVYSLTPAAAAVFPAFFQRDVAPALTHAGINVLAAFESENSVNNFPRLPVREGEHVFVWMSRFADRASADAALARLAQSPQWQTQVAPGLQAKFAHPPQLLRLEPTAHSRLR